MEYSKYLFLNFSGAGFFRDSSKSSDLIYDLNGKTKRADSVQYVEPITVNHISNALHVLMGERPVPSLRKTSMKKIENIFEMANDGYLLITSVKYTQKNGLSRYPDEIKTLRKSAWNSTSTAPTVIDWERVRRFIGNEHYILLTQKLNEVFGEDVVSSYSCVEAMKKIQDQYIDDERIIYLITFFDKNHERKTPMSELLKGGINLTPSQIKNGDTNRKPATFNANPKTLITTNFSVDSKITKIDGEIIIPITDEYLEKIKNNKGFATLLEGGLLWINKIVDIDDMSEAMLEGFTAINTISTETKPITTKKQTNETNS